MAGRATRAVGAMAGAASGALAALAARPRLLGGTSDSRGAGTTATLPLGAPQFPLKRARPARELGQRPPEGQGRSGTRGHEWRWPLNAKKPCGSWRRGLSSHDLEQRAGLWMMRWEGGEGTSGCRGGGRWHTPDSVIWFLLAAFLPFLRVSLYFPRNSSQARSLSLESHSRALFLTSLLLGVPLK